MLHLQAVMETQKLPTTEKDKIDLKNPYAVTKFIGEEIVMKYAEMFKMPIYL